MTASTIPAPVSVPARTSSGWVRLLERLAPIRSTSSSVLWHARASLSGRQLVMFPYLGGYGASYNTLVSRLSGDWDVWTISPPGHGPSVEPAHTRLAELVDHYLEALDEVLRPDAMFFGHSMGGLVAYHTLLAMQDRREFDQRRPSELVLSATCAPRDLQVTGCAGLSGRDLFRHIAGFGCIPPEIADDPSMIELLVPAFRADFQVLEEIQRHPVRRPDVATRLILGERDPQTPYGTPQAWQRHLARPLRTHLLSGAEHMFVLDEPEPVDRILNHEAETLLVGRG